MILLVMRKHLLLVMGIAGSVCGAILLSLVPPMILARIIDGLTTKRMAGFGWIMAYFGLLALTGLMESAREGLLIIFGQKMTHTLRSGLMEKLVHLKADDLSRQEPGSVVSRFVGDVDTVENLFTSGIVSMFADACKIISIVAVIWLKNKGLAIVLLVILQFMFVFTRIVQKNMLAAQIENRRAVGRASGHVPESLHNIRTIHTLGKENYMAERYDEYICESYAAVEKTNFYDAVYSPVILILNAIVVAVVMLFSASGNQTVLTLFGMSAGTAVAVINYISQIFSPVESLGMEIQTIQSAIAGVKRINEFFELPVLEDVKDNAEIKSTLEDKADVKNVSAGAEEIKSTSKDKAVVNSMPEAKFFNNEELQAEKIFDDKNDTPYVQFNNVTFGYEADRIVIDDKTFVVNRGEQVTLSGRTGAGKSTIFKLLLGLYKPQKGSILINDMNSAAIPDNRKRKIFGYVEQSFHMVPGTIKDQITLYDKNISDEAVIKAAKLTGLHDTIMSFENGYDTTCTQEVFSQGQWQLLSIARAAAAKPELLLLDEITANLDAETEKTVLQALKRVSKDRTVLSISHRTMAETGQIIPIHSNK